MRLRLAILAVAALCAGCGQTASPAAPSPGGAPAPGDGAPSADVILSSQALFSVVTVGQPFAGYERFPRLPTSANGTLTASSAHQPTIRVSLNGVASRALVDGRLPAGATFPDGSIVFKEVLNGAGITSLYSIMYKSKSASLAGRGWIWAEIRPDGGVDYAAENKGAGCIGCHSLNDGRSNDLVRIFERQR